MNKTLLFLALLCGSSVYAQLSGTVVDPRGEPIVGASVLLLNQSTPTNIGTVTDFDGNWSLNIYGKNAESEHEDIEGKDFLTFQSIRYPLIFYDYSSQAKIGFFSPRGITVQNHWRDVAPHPGKKEGAPTRTLDCKRLLRRYEASVGAILWRRVARMVLRWPRQLQDAGDDGEP